MRGWQAMQLVELCRLPQRPSDLLEMREAGYGAKARLALDLAVVSFANRFEALRQETAEEEAARLESFAQELEAEGNDPPAVA